MPMIQVSMLEGRTEAQKRALMRALTQATVDALGSAPESVRVVINEVNPLHWAVAGEPIHEWRDKNGK